MSKTQARKNVDSFKNSAISHNMLKKLYDWMISLTQSRHAVVAMAAVSFAESSFFPLPPDLMLVPMGIANRKKVWYYAIICSIASVFGGIFGYAIGALLYDSVGAWLVNLYGMAGKMDTFREWYQANGQWAILLKGLTPIPYKIVTITSGLAGYSFAWFVGLSIITRAGRFLVLAALIHFFGEQIRDFIERRLGLTLALVAVTIVGGFVAVKYLF
jgi:membrane protein YqaA with SNARE-associated domain